jgi:hypothetical protein
MKQILFLAIIILTLFSCSKEDVDPFDASFFEISNDELLLRESGVNYTITIYNHNPESVLNWNLENVPSYITYSPSEGIVDSAWIGVLGGEYPSEQKIRFNINREEMSYHGTIKDNFILSYSGGNKAKINCCAYGKKVWENEFYPINDFESSYGYPTAMDVDYDGDYDILCSFSDNDKFNIVTFLNTGTPSHPFFEPNTTFFNNLPIIDISYPGNFTFFDINNDTFVDLFINETIYKNLEGESWEEANDWKQGLLNSKTGRTVTLQDLTDDGLADMIDITNGIFYENIGNNILPIWRVRNDWTVSCGNSTDGQLYDFDNDGDWDLITTGSVFENNGTKFNPVFEQITDYWIFDLGIHSYNTKGFTFIDLNADYMDDVFYPPNSFYNCLWRPN